MGHRMPLSCLFITLLLMHVGCDGVVGSDQRYDSCGVCGGNNSSCRVVSGLFTRPQLPVGYNLITQIPQAACNLSITELKQSRNYLALRKNDGTFILNGNWAINWSGEFDALGTKFLYHREDDNTAESITSPGPLAESVDLMVIYQQPNPGIKYQYQLPVTSPAQQSSPGVYRAKDLSSLLRQADSPSLPEEKAQRDKAADPRQYGKGFTHENNVFGSDLQGYSGDEAPKPKPKGKKRKFSWRITGFTECSKSCGGGVQTAIVVCIRDKTQLRVPDKRCASLEKPSPQVMRCNLKPCVAEWVGGEWGECSVSCGDGVQTREILCRQEITPTLTMTVAEGACLTPPSPLLQRTRACQRPPCPAPGGLPGQWTIGAWSQCSAKCGQGVQTRSVLCPSGDCNVNERPATETPCNMPSCQSQSHRHLHTWLYTEWPQECSESCGTGVQKRRVVCSAGPKMEGFCDISLRPDQQRSCSSDKHCGALWFTGPWGQCTASCGRGRQSRTIVCLARAQDQLTVVADDKCPASDKPPVEQLCKLQPCGPEWYIGDWSQCSRSCDTGAQRRNVRCLDVNQQVTTGCGETSKPPTRRSCNTQKCPASAQNDKESKPIVSSTQSNDSLRDQPQPPAIAGDGSECRDKFRNCHLVVQARLCKYKYYRTSCCLACHNKL